MATRPAPAAVDDWQTVQPDDWQTVQADKPAPLPPIHVTPDVAGDMFKAGVTSKMLGVTPGVAYENRKDVDNALRQHGGDYDDGKLDPTIANDIAVGIEGSIFGLHHREKLPEEVRNPGLVDKFVSSLSQMVADLPWYAVGGVVGGAVGGAAGSEVPIIGNITGAGVGGAAGAFALPSAARQILVDGIKRGDVKGFGDLMSRAADAMWAATKGAVTGAATELTGGIPVVGVAAKSPLASMAVKGLYQATALTTVGDLMDGRVPSAKDFAGNAALIVPLNLITHGIAMRHSDVEQAQMDRYVKDGTHPAEQSTQLAAQPPVKPDLPPGLRPAIETGEGFVDGDSTENHAELAERVLATKPVTMEELEADPTKADDILENPKIHEQTVIDRAWELKKELVEAGDVETPKDGEKPLTIDDLYDRSQMKSGRGFVTPDGKFLSRAEARKWMKDNEPDVHEMWTNVAGDKSAELHSEDYAAARNRVQARGLVEGDPTITALPTENLRRLAAAREGLNEFKAGNSSKGYVRELLRTLFAGQRDMRIAAATQVRDALKKLIPDYRDQEALSIFRDYKGTPDKLAADLEEIRNGDNDRLKALIPSIERAMNPSPELLEADQRLTDYYTSALAEGRDLGFMDSRIDPSHYSPHILTRILEGEEPSPSGTGSVMSRTTPFGKERKYPTVLDALKTGRIDARTVNALDSLSIYADRHATVVATRLLATELRNTELGKYGTQSTRPEGWVELAPNQNVFRNTRAVTDPETGEPYALSQSLYVPKEVADALKPMFEQGLTGTKLAPLLHAQGYVKMLELGLSFFHVKALAITAMNNMGLTNLVKAMASDVDPEMERGWAADGLDTAFTSTPYEAYEGLKKSSIPTGLDKLADAPIIKQIDAAFKATTEYTFDVVQRKFKVQDASLKAAQWLSKHPDATDAEYFAARRSIAKEVNSAYGGLNWDVLGTGKTVRDVSRLFLLAPDWTFSNVLTAKYSFEGGPAGAAARMFWAKSFATGIAMTAAMSTAIGGRYDPTDAKHIDQVYLGKDDKGKEMYADWFFAGAPKDALILMKRTVSEGPIAGTAQFIVGKASPATGILMGLAANKQGTGAPIYKRGDTIGEKSAKATEYVAGRVLPITGSSVVKTISDALTDPEHQYSYRDLLNLAADAIGSQTYHEGKASGSLSNASRESGVDRFQRAGRSKNRFTIRSRR